MKLSNRTKVVEQGEMTLAERMYLPAIVGGMATTLKHFFSKPVTIRYPEQTRYLGPIYVVNISWRKMSKERNVVRPAVFVRWLVLQRLFRWSLRSVRKGRRNYTEKRSMPKYTRLICFAASSAVFARRLARKKPFSCVTIKWFLFSVAAMKWFTEKIN